MVDILLIIEGLGSGGAQRVVSTVANSWAGAGRDVCVATYNNSGDDFFELDTDVRRVYIGERTQSTGLLASLRASVQRIGAIRHSISECKAPIVLSFVLPMNILVILAAIGLPSRIVVSERNDPKRQNLGWYWSFLRWLLYRLADQVTANSRGAVETMRGYVPEHKLGFLPNPLSSGFTHRARPDEQNRVLLAVGRLHSQKAYDILLTAFADIANEAPKWRLEILGEGPLLEELQAMAKNLGIGSRVIWLGRESQPSVVYQRADLFVLASRYEGMPNALLEAMSTGLPVVVTNASPGPLEYVENLVTGLVVASGDPHELSRAMLRLIQDPQLRGQLGEAARKEVRSLAIENVLPMWEQTLGMAPLDSKTAPT